MRTHTTKSHRTAQLKTGEETDRLLQLLCIVAQTLQRIELKLGKLSALIPNRPNESTKIVAFNGGGRR